MSASSMQSTGQAGRQSSQPVHWSSMTVCMKPGAPTMASTGQGAKHRAQPMHSGSRMRAVAGWGSAGAAPSSRPNRAFSAAKVSWPPGGHKSMGAPFASASA